MACLLGLVCVGPSAASGDAIEAAREHRQQHGARILEQYAGFLSIPNTPQDPQGLRRTAEEVRSQLNARGVEARLWEIEGVAPIVFGRLEVPESSRTIGIYAHYDGQPVDADRWTQPPFQPTLYTRAIEAGGSPRPFPGPDEVIDPEWRIYARSSGDDKAPFGALFAAFDALSAAGIPPTSNLVFFFEGEEERGSSHLGDYIDAHADELDVDLWLICDGPVHQSRRPQLVFGVRGITGLEITVYGAERYLHSGHYGNWAPNPAMMLAQLLASMKDSSGRVTIEGFYDSVEPLDEASQAALARLPAIDEALRGELGLVRTEADNAPLSERMLLPSLNLRGMVSATVGPTARNVIPTVAQASLDIRLVKGNDPDRMLDLVEQHVRAQGYHIVREDPDHATRLAHPRIAKIVREEGYPAVRTPMDLPQIRPVIDAARSAAGGEELVLLPTLGGSLPLYLFERRLHKPLVIVPIANHDNNQHGPDENLRVANLWYGVDLFAALLTMPPPDSGERSVGATR
jgi:acetylornithine deacetylase/succinyl-diaminopimelate desuccinylase-like protein